MEEVQFYRFQQPTLMIKLGFGLLDPNPNFWQRLNLHPCDDKLIIKQFGSMCFQNDDVSRF